MSKTRKPRKNRKHSRKTHRKRRVFNPKRSDIMRGGSVFPASMNNNVISSSPQSFLPFSDISRDPIPLGIASRNTGPFLTGMAGGSRRNRKMKGGMSNAVNNVQPVNELVGSANLITGFSGTASAYSSTPLRITPLA